MKLLDSDRLCIRQLSADVDAEFILELLNEPSFVRHVGDKGVRTLEDARSYIRNGPMASYAKHGFGLYLVEQRASGASMGICGLIRRDGLDDVDIGFAFLPRFWSKGYAAESAAAVLEHARDGIGLRRVVAVTVAENRSSIRLLEKLGFSFERRITLPGDDEELNLYALDAPPEPPIRSAG